MRIGIDARFYGGEQSKGLGRYTQKLIEHVLQIDQSNHYVIFVQDERALQAIQNMRANVEVILAPYRWYTLAEQIFLPRVIARAQVDLMHFPHFNVPLWYRHPFVVTIHDLIISRFPTERATTLGPLKYRFKQFAYNRVIAHAARKAKKIITVSEYSKRDIMDFFHLPSDRIAVTYEAVDQFTEEAKPRELKDVLAQYAITLPYVLYVGNAYPHKNLEILLQVMQRLKQEKRLFFTLVLVGKMDYFYRRLKNEAQALHVDDVVLFPGFVPDEDLPVVYHNALAYMFPSKYEGFGLPALEAMSYGVPVLAARSSCLPEILDEAALYFDFQDVNGIIEKIFAVHTNQVLQQAIVQKGYQQTQKYHWKTLAQETLQIYESVFTQS